MPIFIKEQNENSPGERGLERVGDTGCPCVVPSYAVRTKTSVTGQRGRPRTCLMVHCRCSRSLALCRRERSGTLDVPLLCRPGECPSGSDSRGTVSERRSRHFWARAAVLALGCLVACKRQRVRHTGAQGAMPGTSLYQHV